MDKNDFIFLNDLHQALRTITTSDRNTIIMGKCLEALEQFLIQKNAELQNIQTEKEE